MTEEGEKEENRCDLFGCCLFEQLGKNFTPFI